MQCSVVSFFVVVSYVFKFNCILFIIRTVNSSKSPVSIDYTASYNVYNNSLISGKCVELLQYFTINVFQFAIYIEI